MKATFSGLRAWIWQRATALVVLAAALVALLRLLVAPPDSFEAWRGWWQPLPMRAGALLFFAALALHAWVGMRDIVLDYVKPFALRLAALALLLLGLAGTVAGAAFVLLGLR